jgi:hypothetical protein
LQTEHVDEVVLSTEKILPEKWEMVRRICVEQGAQCRRMRISLEQG